MNVDLVDRERAERLRRRVASSREPPHVCRTEDENDTGRLRPDRDTGHYVIASTGVGKTGLMSGLVLKAVQNGYRALFIKAQDLFDEMYASLADRSTRHLLRTLARVDVLAIDEMGYLNIKPEQTNIFFKLMEERHHRYPTLITTNLPYAAWQDFLGNRALTQALLSRLRERCHTVIIEGPCLRAQQG